MSTNLFIVLDGLDGSGKGEIIKKLHNYFFSKSKKYRVLTTREPTNGEYGRKARSILKEDKDPLKNAETLLDLYIKDRKSHLSKVIDPFLSAEDSHIVLCDRYYYATIAYQQTQGIPLNRLLDLNKEFTKPTISFILDVKPEIALERIKKARSATEKFEKLDFMNNLRKNFLQLKTQLKDNIIIIDANKPLEDVFNQIKEEVQSLL